MSDSARQEFQAMQIQDDRQQRALLEEQHWRKPGEVEMALLKANTEHAKPSPRPLWSIRRQRPTQEELKAVAEYKIDRLHAAEMSVLRKQQRQQQDDFLIQQRRKRLLREKEEVHKNLRETLPSLKRDFDRSR